MWSNDSPCHSSPVLPCSWLICPALCRLEPNGRDLLVANTAEMAKYVKTRAVDNSRQVLDGMFFQQQPPANGNIAQQVFVRYSGAIYNRWDYDASTRRYLRYAEIDYKHGKYRGSYANLLNSRRLVGTLEGERRYF